MLDEFLTDNAGLILAVRMKMAELSPDDRLELMSILFANYCRHCGNHSPKEDCQCWNDE